MEVGAFNLSRGIHVLIDHIHGFLDYTWLFFVAFHAECLACPRLTIGHDGDIEALHEPDNELVYLEAMEGGLF